MVKSAYIDHLIAKLIFEILLKFSMKNVLYCFEVYYLFRDWNFSLAGEALNWFEHGFGKRMIIL